MRWSQMLYWYDVLFDRLQRMLVNENDVVQHKLLDYFQYNE